MTGSVSVRAVAITLMEFSPGMPGDHSARSTPEEVNLAEHFVHLCDIQHRRVSSPNGNGSVAPPSFFITPCYGSSDMRWTLHDNDL